jgi:RNA polymerase sigma-70 factor, ECF subfamily
MALAVEIQLPVNALTQNQTSLTRLIERAASGDTAAFEQIMIHSQQRVMAMTWRILGNEADARDASQEVFLRVYKYLGRFNQDQDFFAWLYGITVNVCRDIAKKRQYHDRFTSLDAAGDEAAFAVPAEQEDAEEALMHTQQRELIARAVATLPFKERASIVLRDVEGLPTDEVARIMKSSSTTVRSQISSARKKIKIYCEQYLRRKERGQSDEM